MGTHRPQLAQWTRAALQSVTFSTSGTTAPPGMQTLAVQVFDGTNYSNVLDDTVNVVGASPVMTEPTSSTYTVFTEFRGLPSSSRPT